MSPEPRLKGGGLPGAPRSGGARRPGPARPPSTGHDWAWALARLAEGLSVRRAVVRATAVGAPQRFMRRLDPQDEDIPLVTADMAACDWRLG